MKRFGYLGSLAVAALLLGGCDAIYWTQYHVSPSERSTPAAGPVAGVEEADRRAIREILARIAANLGYVKADELKTPDTFANYRQNIEHFPLRLTAWTAGRTAVVDVFLFTPGLFWPRAEEYARVRNRAEADLQARFGSRLSRVRLGWGQGKKLLHPTTPRENVER